MCVCYLSISSVWRFEVGCCHWEESPQWKPPVLGCWIQVQDQPHHWGALEDRDRQWLESRGGEVYCFIKFIVDQYLLFHFLLFVCNSEVGQSDWAFPIFQSIEMPTCYFYGFFRGQVLCAASFTHRSAWSKRSHQQHVRQTTGTLRPADEETRVSVRLMPAVWTGQIENNGKTII